MSKKIHIQCTVFELSKNCLKKQQQKSFLHVTGDGLLLFKNCSIIDITEFKGHHYVRSTKVKGHHYNVPTQEHAERSDNQGCCIYPKWKCCYC